jgi:hypothetical protein
MLYKASILLLVCLATPALCDFDDEGADVDASLDSLEEPEDEYLDAAAHTNHGAPPPSEQTEAVRGLSLCWAARF